MIDGLAAPTPEVLESLQEEILLLNRLVDDLRDLAQAEAGQLSLSPEELDLAAELPRIAALHQQAAQRKGVRLTVHADGPLLVRADPARLSQIVRNLISNALTHTAAGGEVGVKAERQGGHITIAVRDNGAGIEAAHLPFVFDRFYRADPSRQRASGGAGLGLAIARQLAQAQGGSIGVESAPGVGSTFTVSLPGVF
jgi:two-component system sensor histidine kinase BaeS